jgi:hypothetical protein
MNWAALGKLIFVLISLAGTGTLAYILRGTLRRRQTGAATAGSVAPFISGAVGSFLPIPFWGIVLPPEEPFFDPETATILSGVPFVAGITCGLIGWSLAMSWSSIIWRAKLDHQFTFQWVAAGMFGIASSLYVSSLLLALARPW